MLYLFTSLSHFTLLGKKAERYMQKSSGGLGLSRGITAAPEGQIVSGVNFVLDYGKSLLLLIFSPPVFFLQHTQCPLSAWQTFFTVSKTGRLGEKAKNLIVNIIHPIITMTYITLRYQITHGYPQ